MADIDLDSGAFARSDSDGLWVSHLSAAFGLAETCAELLQALPEPAFERAWLDYCRLYNASAEEQRQALGRDLGHPNLAQSHARLTAGSSIARRCRRDISASAPPGRCRRSATSGSACRHSV